MKRTHTIIISLLCMLWGATSAWAQSSTEGTDFWVALTMASSPNGLDQKTFEPFIAISAKKSCQVTITNPNTNWSGVTKNVTAGSWTVIKSNAEIPFDQWYDVHWTAASASEATDKKGLYIHSTEEISVYAAIRMENSYDATNVLPITALGTEYIIQDYPAANVESSTRKESRCVFTVLATENNTNVTIVPSNNTLNGKKPQTPFSVQLNKGETYMVLGEDWATADLKASLSGTTVEADKKIAVFNGNVFTQVPGPKSARDCLYEQSFPTDYWGTQFVVTRSLKKDANRIRITAKEDGTSVSIDGHIVAWLNHSQTYECELSNHLADGNMLKELNKFDRPVPDIYTGEAHYIETSCPCAVYSYDVSSTYRQSNGSEYDSNNPGDPSMVWISPLQQRIRQITFGTGGTDKTQAHFVNVTCLTSDVSTFSIVKHENSGLTPIAFTFQPVPDNPTFSYARIELSKTKTGDVYTMSASQGIIANVYGNGDNESYAYSVGSSAIKDGIIIENIPFTDNMVYDGHFCVNTPLTFDANIGTKLIESVDWDFGDGITLPSGPTMTEHVYTTPGWYDLTAVVRSKKLCSLDESVVSEKCKFSFYVQEPTLVRRDTIFCLDSKTPTITFLDTTYATPFDDIRMEKEGECDHIVQWRVHVGKSEEYPVDTVGQDELWYRGKYYNESTPVGEPDTFRVNAPDGCDTIEYVNVVVKHCLKISPKPNVPVGYDCSNTALHIHYQIGPRSGTTGQLSDAINIQFNVAGQTYQAVANNTDTTFYVTLRLHADGTAADPLAPSVYTGTLHYEDPVCGTEYNDPITFSVYYPESIFDFVYTNVLAVRTKTSGYSFIGYQWYRNGLPLIGENKSILHLEENYLPSHPSDMYYVDLTRNDGTTICSCSKSFNGQVGSPYAAPERSEQTPSNQKQLRGSRLCIITDNGTYDSYGNRIE